MRVLLVALAACLSACLTAGQPEEKQGLGGCSVLELTHLLDDRTPYYPTYSQFRLERVQAGAVEPFGYVEWNKFCTYEHMGTHMDAPAHFGGSQRVHDVAMDRLVGEACVLDIRHKTSRDPYSFATKADIEAWEEEHGKLGPHCIFLLSTGNARHYNDMYRYFNTRNISDASSFRFPAFGPDTAELLRDRGVKAIGVDAISLDAGGQGFRVHQVLLRANIPGFENLNNLDKLPPRGATFFGAPTLIHHGSGAPLRAFAVGHKNFDPCSIRNLDAMVGAAPNQGSISFLVLGSFFLITALMRH